MYSKLLIASSLLSASVFATNHGDDHKSPWSGGDAAPFNNAAGDNCCDANQGGYWGDWQGGKPNAGEVIVQVVSVSDANASLKFYPDNIMAAPGSIVQFQFHPKNHTITESSFADPCKPMAANLTSETRPGIKSGFVPVTGQEATTPVYNVLINDTKPIWLYCGQAPHCQRGMAMVINQNSSAPDKTIEIYKQNAAAIPLPETPAAGAAPASSSAAAAAPLPESSVVVPGIGSPETSTTSAFAGLPAPTGSTDTATTTAAVAPAVFTGAASRWSAGSLGLIVAGMAALL